MSSRVPIGVRVDKELLAAARSKDPDFNFSEYVRLCLKRDFGSVEDQVDLFLEKLKGD